MTDTAAYLASVERCEAKARHLLARGFATKSAQKESSEYASRAYDALRSVINDVIRGLHHGARTEALDEVYGSLPYSTHHVRPTHLRMVRTHVPEAEEHVVAVERIVALYQAIKAAPVAPKPEPKKLNDAGLLPLRSNAFNPMLREQFMAQAPALAQSYESSVRNIYSHYLELFEGKVPCDPYPGVYRPTEEQSHRISTIKNLIGDHCDIVGARTKAPHYVLNDEILKKKAERYGELMALQWFYKTNAKLGELSDAVLHKDQGGYVVVSGTKADGSKVTFRQQHVTKWAPVSRVMFSQFPSHCYVDDKFFTAHDYAKRFPDASADD